MTNLSGYTVNQRPHDKMRIIAKDTDCIEAYYDPQPLLPQPRFAL